MEQSLSNYQFVALLLTSIGPVLALARMTKVPDSIVLFGLGVLSAILPGLPATSVDPQFVLNLLLPPIIYASSVRVSWHLLRFTFWPGVLVGAFLVGATTTAVAAGARFVLLPGLSWTGALLLGTVAAIFDTRLFHEAKGRPEVPRAIADTLKARELTGRLLILATFTLLIEMAQAGGSTSPWNIAEHYLWDLPAGVALGCTIGYGIACARQRVDPAPVEIAISVATPYGAALTAHALGLSVVGAITAAALVVSAVRIDRRTGAPISSSEARVSSTAFWEQASLMISSALFFLAGRALPQALEGVETWGLLRLAAATAGVLVLVLTVQFVASYLAGHLPPIARALVAGGGRSVPSGRDCARAATVMTWSSTRSVIGLVIALSIPAALPDGHPFPERNVILALAAVTIVASVLLQGLTLRAVVKRTALADEQQSEQERHLAHRAIGEALANPGPHQVNGFDAARSALVRLREEDRIGDEVLVAMLRETDLMARAEEGDALPGAGPPNP